MVGVTGARQVHIPCPHLQERDMTAPTAMVSKVTGSNLGYFLSEDRVPSDVDREQLEAWHDRVGDEGGDLVACNFCRRVFLYDNGHLDELHGPDPRGGRA